MYLQNALVTGGVVDPVVVVAGLPSGVVTGTAVVVGAGGMQVRTPSRLMHRGKAVPPGVVGFDVVVVVVDDAEPGVLRSVFAVGCIRDWYLDAHAS